jgi:arylsulfatase A-like enzyme
MRFKLKYAIFSLLAAGFLGSASARAAMTPPARPNIIFILTDDQGYGDWSCTGHPLLKTPNVDRLARESVRFERFYVSSSCSPTRAALLTGMHELRNGVTHTQAPRENLWEGATLLPQLLATAGYRNACIGKWHLGDKPGYRPQDRGFEWNSTNQGGPREHFNPVMIRNGHQEVTTGYREDIYFDDAMRFITETKEQPFFLYLSTYSPHDPLAAPEEFVAPFRGTVPEQQAQYLGMIANLDENIGRLLQFLKERDLEEKTIVILMNDNGQTWGLDLFNAGMRGCKATVWEGGSRAFSFWRWSGHWTPHTVENLTAHIDFLPTLCQLAGVSIPEKVQSEIEGLSLLPLLESAEPVLWHEGRRIFHHVGRWPGGMAAAHKYAMTGVREGNFLLIRSRPCESPDCNSTNHGYQCVTLRDVEKGAKDAQYTVGNAAFHWGATPRGHWALYDVKSDPACQNDLAATMPDRAAAMAAAYDAWWDDTYPVMVKRGGDLDIQWNHPRVEAPLKESPSDPPAH